jgi:hypothetical protein
MDTTGSNTTMCILASSLDYFGDSSEPVAVYDGSHPLMPVLGRSEGKVVRGSVRFGGVKFTLRRVTGFGSAYAMLHADV